MCRKFIYFLLVILMLGVCVLYFLSASKNNYLFLENGSALAVDFAWADTDVVIYKINGETQFINKNNVRDILVGPVSNPRNLLKKVFCSLFVFKNRVSDFFLNTKIKGIALWMVVSALLSTVCLCATLLFIIKFRKCGPSRNKGDIVESDHDSEKKGYRLADISDVKEYFLNLFRIQLGASLKDPGFITHSSEQKTGPGEVYKMSVKINGEWKSRGLTIGPLGEESGSRSQCFYIIFDTHMVVKIPVVPIRDFSDYIERIRYEKQIVDKLAPAECIIPNVSVIMDKINQLPDAKNLTASSKEERYMSLLKTSPQYHEYLKIGGKFAFFMDLSQYYFLRHVMVSLHTIEDHIRDVITSDAGYILDHHEFDNKYGNQSAWICSGLQKLFGLFDRGINDLVAQSGASLIIDEGQRKDWLFAGLACQDIANLKSCFDSRFVSEIHTLLQHVLRQELKIVMAYRTIAGEYAKSRLFARNKLKMEQLITNLLEMLSCLGKNNVAMRDLKPDNLLVAGDPEKYPLFLSSAGEYTIGLIDLETAVDYKPAGSRPPRQPQFGGTPAYATVSHFFPNDRISSLRDLQTILHMQDWYAVVGIIFEVVVGKRLFRKTALRVAQFVQDMQQSSIAKKDMQSFFENESRLFWRIAVSEFTTETNKNEKWLKSLNVVCPETIRNQFKNHLENKIKEINYRIKRRVDEETLFNKKENREQILRSSHDEIRRIRVKYMSLRGSSSVSEAALKRLLGVLEELACLKEQCKELAEKISRIDSPMLKLSVMDLMDLMFHTVFHHMYPEEWGDLTEEDTHAAEAISSEEFADDDMKTLDVGYTATVQFSS